MNLVNRSNAKVSNLEPGNMEGDNAHPDIFKPKVDELFTKVDKLEQRVTEVEKFFLNLKVNEQNISKSASTKKDGDKDKHIPSMKKLNQESSRREAAAAKRMQELMRHFGTLFRQITQHKWAWPFMQPVDVEGLGLDDYYQIIDRPMDFSTIKNQMETKDGTGYKHVREIYSDVQLVFRNAMKYNDEKSDVHVMAKTLFDKFKEKWLQFLPKVTEEQEKRNEEEAEAQMNIQLAQVAAHGKLVRDIIDELYEVDTNIEELREMVIKKCRKISSAEKRKLGIALSQLCPEDLSKALEIVSRNNPNFQVAADVVELDLNAQSESTLWRLKFFVKDVMKSGNDVIAPREAVKKHDNSIVYKRKKEICDALAKNAKRRKKNLSS